MRIYQAESILRAIRNDDSDELVPLIRNRKMFVSHRVSYALIFMMVSFISAAIIVGTCIVRPNVQEYNTYTSTRCTNITDETQKYSTGDCWFFIFDGKNNTICTDSPVDNNGVEYMNTVDCWYNGRDLIFIAPEIDKKMIVLLVVMVIMSILISGMCVYISYSHYVENLAEGPILDMVIKSNKPELTQSLIQLEDIRLTSHNIFMAMGSQSLEILSQHHSFHEAINIQHLNKCIEGRCVRSVKLLLEHGVDLQGVYVNFDSSHNCDADEILILKLLLAHGCDWSAIPVQYGYLLNDDRIRTFMLASIPRLSNCRFFHDEFSEKHLIMHVDDFLGCTNMNSFNGKKRCMRIY